MLEYSELGDQSMYVPGAYARTAVVTRFQEARNASGC